MTQSDSGSLPSPHHPARGPVPAYRSHTGLHECPILTWTHEHFVSLPQNAPGECPTENRSHLRHVEDLVRLKLWQALLQLLLGAVGARGGHGVEELLEKVQVLTGDTGYKEDRSKAEQIKAMKIFKICSKTVYRSSRHKMTLIIRTMYAPLISSESFILVYCFVE